MQPLACCFNDRKCPKLPLVSTDFSPRRHGHHPHCFSVIFTWCWLCAASSFSFFISFSPVTSEILLSVYIGTCVICARCVHYVTSRAATWRRRQHRMPCDCTTVFPCWSNCCILRASGRWSRPSLGSSATWRCVPPIMHRCASTEQFRA